MVQTVKAVAKTLATLLLLALVIPVNARLAAVAMGYQGLRRVLQLERAPARLDFLKSVLISGGKLTKALQLARLFL